MATTKAKAAPAPKAKPAAKAKAAAKAPAKKAPAKRPAVKPSKLKPETATLRDEAASFMGQAGDKVRKVANTGKERATGAMDDVAAMVEDVARTLDERVGPQYGDYARKAASAVSGVADGIKSKEVDQLLDDARNFVRQKPAIAIGAAAALGFVLTRLIKAGSDDDKA